MDILPENLASYIKMILQENTISSWRLQESKTITLSIRFTKSDTSCESTPIRSQYKPPSSLKRDFLRKQAYLTHKHEEGLQNDSGYVTEKKSQQEINSCAQEYHFGDHCPHPTQQPSSPLPVTMSDPLVSSEHVGTNTDYVQSDDKGSQINQETVTTASQISPDTQKKKIQTYVCTRSHGIQTNKQKQIQVGIQAQIENEKEDKETSIDRPCM